MKHLKHHDEKKEPKLCDECEKYPVAIRFGTSQLCYGCAAGFGLMEEY